MLEKSYGDLKIPKIACSKLVRYNGEKISWFFFFFNLQQGRYSIIKIFFYVAKPISFEVISILKLSTFAAALIFLWPLLQFLT